jgi:hypothetical protein
MTLVSIGMSGSSVIPPNHPFPFLTVAVSAEGFPAPVGSPALKNSLTERSGSLSKSFCEDSKFSW